MPGTPICANGPEDPHLRLHQSSIPLRLGAKFQVRPGNAVCPWSALGMSLYPALSPAQVLDMLVGSVFPGWTPGMCCSLSPVLPLALLAGWTLDPCGNLAFTLICDIISFCSWLSSLLCLGLLMDPVTGSQLCMMCTAPVALCLVGEGISCARVVLGSWLACT